MRKNGLSKMLALVLMFVMIGSVLAGCGGGGELTTEAETPEETTQGGEEVSQEDTAAGEESTESESIVITYPLTDATGPITWYTKSSMAMHSSYVDPMESPIHSGLITMTGVDIDWVTNPVGANADTTWNLMQQEELPYIVTGNKLGYEEMYEEGLIWDLTDYLPEYAPDYWAYINSDEEIFDAVKMMDGRICTFVGGRDERTAFDEGLVIRKDWLDECGLELPDTMSELETVLRAFKDRYGIVPMSGLKGLFTSLSCLASGTGAYGGFGINLYRDENGTIQCGQVQEEHKALLETLRRWYADGLLDPDITTVNKVQLRTKANNNECGVAFCDVQTASRFQLEATDPNAEWVGLPCMVPEEGDQAMYSQYINKVNTNIVTIITKACPEEHLITALKLLNYGYTEEGIRYYNFNQEGLSFYFDENGEEQWTDLVVNDADGGVTGGVVKYSPLNSEGNPTFMTWHFAETRYVEMAVQALETWGSNSEIATYKIPPLRYTAEEADRRADLLTTIETYGTPMAQKFVFGEVPMEDWDKYVAELYALGLEEVIEITQTAYDRTYKD